jgi:hypothetical protein
MRFYALCLLLLPAAAMAATVNTPAGKADVGPQPQRQYVRPAQAPPADPNVSWGKAGVPFAEYKRDAVYCSAYGTVYALNAPAWAITRDGDLWDAVAMHYQNRDFVRLGQGDIEHCLAMRGYSPFHLTPDEIAHLATLQAGSEERRQYLYSLGSDPQTLAAGKF